MVRYAKQDREPDPMRRRSWITGRGCALCPWLSLACVMPAAASASTVGCAHIRRFSQVSRGAAATGGWSSSAQRRACLSPEHPSNRRLRGGKKLRRCAL
jgi:hypothetical protein